MKYTERGFGIIDPIDSKYHGKMIVQQSSSVSPSIWVFSEKAYSNNPTTDPKPDLHLSLNDAIQLRDNLNKMIFYIQE